MPVSTTSWAPRAWAARTSAKTCRSSTERECPRAFHTMQKVQRLSQPSCTLMPGRVRPVGVVRARLTVFCSSSATTASRLSSASSTRLATCRLSASTTTCGDMAESSSENRLATHPVATTTGPLGWCAACRTALRVLACASPVTAQVLTTMTSASRSPTIWQPRSWRERAIASISTRFTRQPRLTSATRRLAPRLMPRAPGASRASPGGAAVRLW